MTDFLEVARRHTALGYCVFPTQPGSKEPLRRSRGVHDATRDERQFLHWALAEPNANVAIAPGASGATVLDIDSKAGASPRDVFGDLELDERDLVLVWSGEAPEPNEQHPHSLAGERGAHVWYAGARPTVPKTRIRGVEIRSDNVYVLAPGSSHPSGVLYDGALRHVRALPPAPASVVELHKHGAEEFGTGHLIVPKDGEPIESPRAPGSSSGGRSATSSVWASSTAPRSSGCSPRTRRVSRRRCRPRRCADCGRGATSLVSRGPRAAPPRWTGAHGWAASGKGAPDGPRPHSPRRRAARRARQGGRRRCGRWRGHGFVGEVLGRSSSRTPRPTRTRCSCSCSSRSGT